MSTRRVGVDVGGTFTDIVTISNGSVSVEKVPSTPERPERGVMDGIERLSSIDPIEFFAHGTTVATNAVLERDWAETALITTRGFRDVLEIGRQARPSLYDLQVQTPDPVVRRAHRFEVDERLDERGRVRTSIDEGQLTKTIDAITESGVESVAISLLFSYENNDHERRIAQAVTAADPSLSVSRSSTVLPEIREYERTVATALNAALKPIMDRYLGRLEAEIGELGIGVPLHIMQSNGGVMRSKRARTQPIKTVLSGPAAGVSGAAHIASLAGYENVITMDMGGTSCDVSVIEGGDPVVSTDITVGEYPVSIPMVDVHTIGAGGGSIAWIDAGGALRVGPKSAGADPGPICYGRGGTDPTVTDAHVVLGRIDPTRILSDGRSVREERIDAAIRSTMGEVIDQCAPTIAEGIIDVANANMERALRVVSVERGLDPRDFALVAFGGAGPLHATTLARSIGIPAVLVPRTAGVLSALGLLITDLSHELSTSMVRKCETVDPSRVSERIRALADNGRSQLSEEGIPKSSISIDRAVEMRYVGQSFTLRVPIESDSQSVDIDRLAHRFHERHAQRYGHASPEEPLELVTLRVRVSGQIDPPDLEVGQPSSSMTTDPNSTRSVIIDGIAHDTPIFERDTLDPGTAIDGPAIIEGAESTVLVHPDQVATTDAYGTLVIREEDEGE